MPASKASTQERPAYRFDLVFDKQGESLLVEAMTLLNDESAVQAERKSQHNLLGAIQYVVDYCYQHFIALVEAKTGCN